MNETQMQPALIIAAAVALLFLLLLVAAVSQGKLKMMTQRRYRSESGRFYFDFTFALRSDGTWRIYINTQPPYSSYGRDDSLHATHRLHDGQYYICWTDPIRSLDNAKSVAKLWAEKTADYLTTGRRF